MDPPPTSNGTNGSNLSKRRHSLQSRPPHKKRKLSPSSSKSICNRRSSPRSHSTSKSSKTSKSNHPFPTRKKSTSPPSSLQLSSPSPRPPSSSSSPSTKPIRRRRGPGRPPKKHRDSSNTNGKMNKINKMDKIPKIKSGGFKMPKIKASKLRKAGVPKFARKQDVTPWSFGQRIIVSVQDDSSSNEDSHSDSDSDGNNDIIKSKSSSIDESVATIRDYDPITNLTHIWHETEDHRFEDVDLLQLEDWDIATTKPLEEQIPFVPDDEWVPMNWEMGQRVMVQFDGKFGRGLEFTAFIDGFDPQSRRHHINYGDTTEWIWATRDRVTVYDGECEDYVEELRKEFKRTRKVRAPPPWNPKIYGLTDSFTKRSVQLEMRRKKLVEHRKTTSNTKNRENVNLNMNHQTTSSTKKRESVKKRENVKSSNTISKREDVNVPTRDVVKKMKSKPLKLKRRGTRIESIAALPLRKKDMVSTRNKKMNITMKQKNINKMMTQKEMKRGRKVEGQKIEDEGNGNGNGMMESMDYDLNDFSDGPILMDDGNDGMDGDNNTNRGDGNFRKFPNGAGCKEKRRIYGNKDYPKRVEFVYQIHVKSYKVEFARRDLILTQSIG